MSSSDLKGSTSTKGELDRGLCVGIKRNEWLAIQYYIPVIATEPSLKVDPNISMCSIDESCALGFLWYLQMSQQKG